jgi:hypothetical protein
MNRDIIIQVAAFFGFLFFCVFLFRKIFRFRIKVFFFDVIALNSEIEGLCGSAEGLADSKRVTHGKKIENEYFNDKNVIIYFFYFRKFEKILLLSS